MTTPVHPARPASWLHRILVVVACAIVGGFYVWTLDSTGFPWNLGEQQDDYYNLLIDGYLDGQLHMKVAVPEALKALPDPYDPAQRPTGLGLHDASYYRGKYYVYFGAAPMITLMLPFRLISGIDLPLPMAVMVFLYGMFLASVWVFLAIRRRCFPETAAWVVLPVVLVLGMANSAPVMLRRPDMWELPIAGAACFAMLMLGCVWRAVWSERSRDLWFAAAGLCLGLAIASRPNYLIASPCLAAPLIGWAWREKRLPWRTFLHAVVPLAFIGTLMAWHNYARFGSPLQFGQAYQFSLDYESKLPHFALRYVPFNLKAHFLVGADWSPYFPFISRPNLGAAPVGFTIHRGDVYGLFVGFPFLLLAFLAPAGLWRRSPDERGRFGTWLATASILFLLAMGVMVSFFSALARYQGDFLPTLVLLSAVGFLALERWLQLRSLPAVHRGMRTAWMIAAAYTVMFAVIFSLQFDGLLRERDPALAERIARRLNWVPALIEPLLGIKHGGVEFPLTLPAVRTPGRETIMTVGELPDEERIFLQTLPDGAIRVGAQPPNGPEFLSAPLNLNAGTEHRVRVSLGALYPPITHPFFGDVPPSVARRAHRETRVEVDGKEVLTFWRRAAPVPAGRIRLGNRSLGVAAAPRFRGTIGPAVRLGHAGLPSAEGGGVLAGNAPIGTGDTLRLTLRFPLERPREREPLVVTGRTGAGDLLFVEYLENGPIRFVLDHWGTPLRFSPPVTLDQTVPHEVEVTMPSLAVVEDAGRVSGGKSGRVQVRVDGAPVWDETTFYHASEAEEVTVGRNRIGGTSGGAAFTGEILTVARRARE